MPQNGIERFEERADRLAEELSDAGADPDERAAEFLARQPHSLRRAILNDLNGEGWGTVESRRHDELCFCDRCVSDDDATAPVEGDA